MTQEALRSSWAVRRLNTLDENHLQELTDVLMDCVEGGASVSFMQPLSCDRALSFWRDVAHDVSAGKRALLVAEDEHGICGTVQLIFDLPENQPHRADLAKMLVHRRARHQGIASAILVAAEATRVNAAKPCWCSMP